MSEPTEQGLLPPEHRGLRELQATARRLRDHWRRLGGRLGGEAGALLEEGAAAVDPLLAEIAQRTEAHDLQTVPAAQASGGGLAGLRSAGDLLLERNQALRTAVLDLQHVVTLLIYLGGLADSRGDAGLAEWERGWAERLGAFEPRARDAVAALGRDPEAAQQPADPGPAGRAGQRVGLALGALGEAIDQSRIGQMARRRRS
jgi:hypothetical protein